MISPVDGTASLDVRVAYLKRRRDGRLGSRGVIAGWAGVGAVCFWTVAAAVTSLVH